MTITQLHLEAHANVAFNLDIPRASISGYRGVMHIRQYPGARGIPVIELPPVTVAGTGVRIVGGNTIRLRIDAEAMDEVYRTYSVNLEAGRAIVFYYDLVLSPLGGEGDIVYEGFFTLKGGVTRGSFNSFRTIPRVGIMGDSIMQANHILDTGQRGLDTGNLGEVAWAQTLFPNFRIDSWKDLAEETDIIGCNLARGGLLAGPGNDIALEIGARMARLITLSPDIIVLAVGTNNINSGNTAAATATFIQNNAQQALDAGIHVVLATIRPYSAAFSTGNPAKKAAVIACNDLLRAWAAGRAGVTLWDVFADYDDGTGAAKANYLYDFVHPTMRGAFNAAPRLANIFRELTGGTVIAVPTGLNLIVNPNMADTGPNGTAGAGVTGTVGTGWSIVRALGTPAVVAGHDAGGNQTIAITGGGAATEKVRTGYEFGGPAIIAGQWFQASLKVRLSTWAGWKGVNVLMGPYGSLMGRPLATADSMESESDVMLTFIGAPQLATASENLPINMFIEFDGTIAGSGTATVIEKRVTVVPDPRPLHGVAV